jgi:hypothetical protein
MSERQLGVGGLELRTPFASVSDGIEKQREEKVTRAVEKNRKLRSKKDMTESREEKESTKQSKKVTKSRNSQILMFLELRVAMGEIKIMKNKGVLSEIRNRLTRRRRDLN